MTADTILDFSVKARVWRLDEELQAATEAFVDATVAYVNADDEYQRADRYHGQTESRVRIHLLDQGVEGKDAAERSARLAHAIMYEPNVVEARLRRNEAAAARTRAEHTLRVADVQQKCLRARLSALSATLSD